MSALKGHVLDASYEKTLVTRFELGMYSKIEHLLSLSTY